MTQSERERLNGRLAAAHSDLGYALAALARAGCTIQSYSADPLGPRVQLAAPPRRPLPGAEQIGEHSSGLYGGAPAESWEARVHGCAVLWEVRHG
jgi:hypothetical protein